MATVRSLSSSVDIAIIGAGAAGIGAARALERSTESLLVHEAGDRVGGRAWNLCRLDPHRYCGENGDR